MKRKMPDFKILVNSLLLHLTRTELTVLFVTVAVIIAISLVLAAREIKKRRDKNA